MHRASFTKGVGHLTEAQWHCGWQGLLVSMFSQCLHGFRQVLRFSPPSTAHTLGWFSSQCPWPRHWLRSGVGPRACALAAHWSLRMGSMQSTNFTSLYMVWCVWSLYIEHHIIWNYKIIYHKVMLNYYLEVDRNISWPILSNIGLSQIYRYWLFVAQCVPIYNKTCFEIIMQKKMLEIIFNYWISIMCACIVAF